jgi:hypothetical protein
MILAGLKSVIKENKLQIGSYILSHQPCNTNTKTNTSKDINTNIKQINCK